MPDKLKLSLFFRQWLYAPFVLMAISLFYARSLTSISIVLMAIVIIYQLWFSKDFKIDYSHISWKVLLVVFIVFGLHIIDVFRLGITQTWWNEIVLKIPLIIAPIYMISVSFSGKKGEYFFALLIGMVVFTAMITVVNYWLNYEEINALLLQSKHVPVFGGTHHIYFGIFMTLGFWTSLYFYWNGLLRFIWVVFAILLLVFMHIIVSRTGLMAFYLSAFVAAMWVMWHYRKNKYVVIFAIGGLILPILAYQFSGSLRNKVENTFEDFKAVSGEDDINFKSFAMRVEAWKMTSYIIKSNLIFGVGAEKFDEQLQNQYIEKQSVLLPENRIGPHNQFLEIMAKYGVLAAIPLLLLFIYPIKHFIDKPFLLVLAICFLFAFMLESLLERQLGMIAFSIFYWFGLSSKKMKRQ